VLCRGSDADGDAVDLVDKLLLVDPAERYDAEQVRGERALVRACVRACRHRLRGLRCVGVV
jgi:hypothetical protein